MTENTRHDLVTWQVLRDNPHITAGNAAVLDVGMKTAGQLVKAARNKIGLSQLDLANRMGKDRSHLSNLERNKNQGSGGDLRTALAHGFNVTQDVMGDYVEGRIGLDEFVAQIGQTTRARPDDDPIAERAEALSILRGAKMPDSIIVALRGRSQKPGDRTLTVVEWCAQGQELLKLQTEQAKIIEAHTPREPDPPQASAADRAKAIAAKKPKAKR